MEMPDKAKKAYTLWKKGMKSKEISARLDVSESTVRSWISRYFKQPDAEKKTSKKKEKRCNETQQNVATKNETKRNKVATKKSSGGQPGNVNATGHSMSDSSLAAHKGNEYTKRHGAFSSAVSKLLSEEERAIFLDSGECDPLKELRDNYTALELSEFRILKAIAVLQKKAAQLGTDPATGMMATRETSTKIEEERGVFADRKAYFSAGDEDDVDDQTVQRLIPEIRQIAAAPSPQFSDDMQARQTRTEKALIGDKILTYEGYLDRIRAKKIKILSDIERITMERKKLEQTESGSETAELDAWLNAVITTMEDS